MNTLKSVAAALLLIVILGAMACGPGEPAVTQIVVEVTATPEPTATQVPTYTPLPTHTPYPTYTPYPTLTPIPTATPRPTPKPTLPPPTATPTIVAAVPTPFLPMPETWDQTGNWYRDHAYENQLKAIYTELGMTGQFTAATLDADPDEVEFADLALTLVCIDGAKVVMLTPYTEYVPPTIDTYLVGIWDYGAEDWVSGAIEYFYSPTLNDIGSSIVVTNNIQIRRVMEVLHQSNPHRNHALGGGMYDSEEGGEVILAQWDATGIKDAVEYLGCF